MTKIEKIYLDRLNAPSDINEHLPALREFASRCKHVTEFGVRKINSTWALLAGSPERLVSYDTVDPSTKGGNLNEVYDVAKEMGVEYDFMQGSSLEVDIEPTELLFIDTLHTYDQLKQELRRHASKVSKYIILHDTTTFGTNGEIKGSQGLQKAINEFLIDNANWTMHRRYTNNNGLTILQYRDIREIKNDTPTSFIITYHNEGQKIPEECVRQLHASCKLTNYEVIVMDDCSDIPLQPIEGAKIVRNEVNLGVGESYNKGVSLAKGENIFLVTCDIRFMKNSAWALYMSEDIDLHPKAVITVPSVAITSDDMNYYKKKLMNRIGYGADILPMHVDEKRKENRILDLKWAGYKNKDIQQVPCVLGACYAIKKSWFDHIDGWAGFVHMGFLDAWISLKSWLFGGECLIDTRVDVAHIYQSKDIHGRTYVNETHNKLLLCALFAETEALWDYLKGENTWNYKAKQLVDNKADWILNKKKEYKAKGVKTLEEVLNYLAILKENPKK